MPPISRDKYDILLLQNDDISSLMWTLMHLSKHISNLIKLKWEMETLKKFVLQKAVAEYISETLQIYVFVCLLGLA